MAIECQTVGGSCVAVFAKPPQPGRVKTRLAGALGEVAAAELQRAFLADLLERLATTGRAVRLLWALEPGEEAPVAPVPGLAQEGEDLGDRMLAASRALAREFDPVLGLGADLPDLPLGRLAEAEAALAGGADAVFGPATDGGFYLFGLGPRARRPELFAGVPWGGERVLAEVLARARRLGLSVRLLAVAADVDRPEDLEPLARRLVAARGAGCPRTVEALFRHGLAAGAEAPCAS
ncbi:MAG TPA: TIGR04282 family arsenosugar biosynthesis glycosyltransferase [Thermoanaerobaculia bacterium]|nr:TIGR04282 family arsenosugar biosynthesis glycosyltransferase [Thermoanaerobaculia bacterium]